MKKEEDHFLANIIKKFKLNASLVNGCWELLDEDVRDACVPEANSQSALLDNKLIAHFVGTLRKLQNEYKENTNSAIADFKEFGKQEISKKNLLLYTEAVNPLKPYISEKDFLHNIKCLRTEQGLSKEGIDNSILIGEILVGLVTKKDGHKRSPDPTFVGAKGEVNQAILKASILYIDKNKNSLKALNLKERKYIGEVLKDRLIDESIGLKDSKIDIFNKVNKALSNIDLDKEIAMARALTQIKLEETIFDKIKKEASFQVNNMPLISKIKKDIVR